MTECVCWEGVCGIVVLTGPQRIKKALLLSYNVESGKAKVTESDRRDIKSETNVS